MRPRLPPPAQHRMASPSNSVRTDHDLLPKTQAAGEPPEEASHGQPAVELGLDPEAGVGLQRQALSGSPRPQVQSSRAKATRQKTSENCSHLHSVGGSECLTEPPTLRPARMPPTCQCPHSLRRGSQRHGAQATLNAQLVFRASLRYQAPCYC